MTAQPELTERDYELLSAYLDGELTDTERSALEIRLLADARLRAELDALHQVRLMVRAMPILPAPRSFALTQQMLQAAAPQRPRVLSFPASLSTLMAAAAVLVVAMGLLVLVSGGGLGGLLPAAPPPAALDVAVATLDETAAALPPAGTMTVPAALLFSTSVPEISDLQRIAGAQAAEETEAAAEEPAAVAEDVVAEEEAVEEEADIMGMMMTPPAAPETALQPAPAAAPDELQTGQEAAGTMMMETAAETDDAADVAEDGGRDAALMMAPDADDPDAEIAEDMMESFSMLMPEGTALAAEETATPDSSPTPTPSPTAEPTPTAESTPQPSMLERPELAVPPSIIMLLGALLALLLIGFAVGFRFRDERPPR